MGTIQLNMPETAAHSPCFNLYNVQNVNKNSCLVGLLIYSKSIYSHMDVTMFVIVYFFPALTIHILIFFALCSDVQ